MKNEHISREEKLKKHARELQGGHCSHVDDLIEKYNITPEEFLEVKRKYCDHSFRYNPDKQKYYCHKCLLEVK